ncbi:uncharacterized protein LOC121700098 isoform X1 [Alosa sapidissima]|uniref:uncharacterized protein LOC121700098 isoform X1 n=1 Tax=Alosa sapidissima TaxID=34773 RepID=UPI001C08011D|nr:uncharacterized protein LOC121700098 isoform X1 [Alosa sapidissima]
MDRDIRELLQQRRSPIAIRNQLRGGRPFHPYKRNGDVDLRDRKIGNARGGPGRGRGHYGMGHGTGFANYSKRNSCEHATFNRGVKMNKEVDLTCVGQVDLKREALQGGCFDHAVCSQGTVSHSGVNERASRVTNRRVAHGTHYDKQKGDQTDLQSDVLKNIVKEVHFSCLDSHSRGPVTDTNRGVHERASRKVSTDRRVAHGTHDKKKDNIMDLKSEVFKMIVKDLHPPHLVEEAGFRALLNVLNPSGQIPSNASWARSQLQKMYEDKKAEVKKALSCSECIVLTAEIWQRSSENHLTVSCHFLDEKWRRKSYILETTRLFKGHCVDSNVARIASTWGIDKKISVVVSNLANMKEPFHKRGWFDMPCFAHILNAMFETSTKSVWGDQWKDLLKKCNDILDNINGDQGAAKTVKEHQVHSKSATRPLHWPVDEKWPSTLNMLERILEQNGTIKASHISHAESEIWINAEDDKRIKEAVAVLRLFKDAMQHLGIGYHSISEIIPLLVKTHGKLTKVSSNIGKEIAKKCERRIFEMKQNRWLTFSRVLDPRFKLFPFADQPESKKADIVDEMKKLNSPGHCQKGSSRGLQQDFQSVLECYLQEPLHKEKNPLEFWRVQTNLTALIPLVRKYLTVVSTPLPSERAFRPDVYKRQNMKRSCLQPEDVNMMLFLQGNLTVGH